MDSPDSRGRPVCVLCECECWSDRGPVFPGGGRAPQARAVTHGHGPPLVGKQHGLYVVDVGDGEWAPVFSYDHSQARDRTRRGGRPDRSPFEVQGTAPSRTLGGRLALGETIHS